MSSLVTSTVESSSINTAANGTLLKGVCARLVLNATEPAGAGPATSEPGITVNAPVSSMTTRSHLTSPNVTVANEVVSWVPKNRGFPVVLLYREPSRTCIWLFGPAPASGSGDPPSMFPRSSCLLCNGISGGTPAMS